MEIYYALIILNVLCCLLEIKSSEKTKFYTLAILCTITALFGGLRWEVGNDWGQYYDHFKASKWSNIFSYNRGISTSDSIKLEPGFVFINVLLKSIFKTFYWYNLIICSFIQFSYYKFIKYHCPQYPLLLYAAILIMSINFFPVRSGLSIGVCLWSFRFIKEQRLIPFVIIVALASLIHVQCIVLLPLYWAGIFRFKNYVYALIFIIIFLMGRSLQNYFGVYAVEIGGDIGAKLQYYTEVETEEAQKFSILNALTQFGLLCLYLNLPGKKVFGSEKWYYSLINMYILYLAISYSFSDGMGELARIKDPFSIVMPLLLVYGSTYYLKSKEVLVKIGVFLFLIIYISRRIIAFGSGYYFKLTCIPYRTIFDYRLF